MSSLFLAVTVALWVQGQPIVLDMETALSIGRERNHSLNSKRIALEQAVTRERAAWVDRYLPRLDIAFTAPSIREYSAQQIDPGSGLFEWYDRESRLLSGGITLQMPLPTDGYLDVRLSGQRWEDIPRDTVGDDDATITSSLSFTLNQPLLDRSSGTSIALEKARISLQQARLSYQQTLFEADFVVSSAFLVAVRAQEQARIDSLELAVATENAELGHRKISSGLLSEGDALELQLQAATARAAHISSQAARRQRMEDLLLVLGLPVDSSASLVLPPPPVEPILSMERALACALQRRRELTEQRFSLTLAALNIAQTRQTVGPSIDLLLGFDFISRGESWEPAWDGSSHERRISLGFSVPLLDFGRGAMAIRQTELAHELVVLTAENLERNVMAEVRGAVRDIQTVTERTDVLRQALGVAEESYRISTARFEAGNISSQRLLDAQLSLFRARTNVLAARIDLDIAIRRLQKITMARVDELTQTEEE